jgi:hypothetical protein
MELVRKEMRSRRNRKGPSLTNRQPSLSIKILQMRVAISRTPLSSIEMKLKIRRH